MTVSRTSWTASAARPRGGRRETFWIDRQGKLAAYKGVDAEFDHFEAIRRG
jgi:hypothetical protein